MLIRPTRLACLLTCCLATAWGVDWKALKPQGYLSDFAGVVDAQSRQELERYCARVKEQTGAEIALVTLRSLEGEPVEDVANTIFRAWGVGEKGKNNGILLLLAVRERRSRLEVGYELEPLIPDGFAGGLLRSMRPALRESHYGEALMAAAHEIGARIAQARGAPLDTAPRRRIQARPYHAIPWPLLLGGAGLLVLIGVLAVRRRPAWRAGGDGFWTGMTPGDVMSPSVHLGGSSHGGFGGYDSGDSFGGFGGGDSGGGGASSDW